MSGGGGGLWTPSVRRGRGQICDQFLASPIRVKTGGTGYKTEKQEKIGLLVHFSWAYVTFFFSPPILFPPSWSFMAALTWIFQQEVKKPDQPFTVKLMGGGKRQSWPGEGWETGQGGWGVAGRGGKEACRPENQQPCLPESLVSHL